MVANDAEALIRKSEAYDKYYDPLHELGRGRFAVVKKCVNKQTGKHFAAKIIKKSRTNTQGRSGREQLLLEIDILNKSNHPKLVRLYDVFETRAEMQLILELAPGGDLHRHCIEGDVTRTEKEICYLIRQITEAVRYLHDQSIVHLDLKPDNILLANECEIFPEIRLIDFGLSRRLDVPYSQFDIVGTPEYVAPEVLAYEPIDYGSDMWSIGVVTYVLLSGISPFAGDDVMETYANIGMVDYDFDCEEFDEISEPAIDFIEKLLVRSPKKRMTAREALEHEWLKQLEGGITKEDVAYATHAQQEPLPDTEVSTPLVEEDYPSSSGSETPLEKSIEMLNDNKDTTNQRESVFSEESTKVNDEKKNISSETSNEEKEPVEKEIVKKEKSKNEDDQKPSKNIEKENEEKDEVKGETSKQETHDIVTPPIIKLKTEKKNEEADIQVKEVKELPTKQESLVNKQEEVEVEPDQVKGGKPTLDEKKDVPTQSKNESKFTSCALSEEKESDVIQKAPCTKSKSAEFPPKQSPNITKRGSTDGNLSAKPSAIEQRKLALQLKMSQKDDPIKGIKIGRAEAARTSTNDKFSRTPSSGSNRSSANSSPGEIRKNANRSPILRRIESPHTKKTPTQSPSLTLKTESKTNSAEPSPKISRNSVRGKIPGGIALKMANKFSNIDDSPSSSGRSSPQVSQKLDKRINIKEEKSLRDKQPSPVVEKSSSINKKLNENKEDEKQNEIKEEEKRKDLSSATESSNVVSGSSSPRPTKPLKISEKQNSSDIKFSLALGGGGVSPAGKKLTIGPLVSCGEKKDVLEEKPKEEEKEENSKEEKEIEENKENNDIESKQPIRMKMSGTGAPIKLGIGRPQRKSTEETFKLDEAKRERAPMLKETRGKSQSLSRRRAGTQDGGSPNSPRKNYRRLYVTKVRNSRIFNADFNIDSAAAAEIMQRVDNDVLKVEFRLKSTDLKLLPQ